MRVNSLIKKLYEQKGPPFLTVIIVGLFVFENMFPLRKRKAAMVQRIVINGKTAATSALGFRYFLIPVIVWASLKSEDGKKGLLQQLAIPYIIKFILGFMGLDYGNYVWHRLSHSIPLLWRFHQVHHSDLDLDLSTAFRFHIGEILPSALFRAAIVWLLGVNWKVVLYYEIAFEAANSFHHCNLKLALPLEQNLTDYIVTPSMHGIHHSIVRNETNSNYSVIFSFWDRIHQTLKLGIPQEKINIGMPAYRNTRELGYFNLMTMPFQKQRKWELPDGEVPRRTF
ncbi:MAG: sterol desaturase family protein [Bacteroidota bacterium]|nr:sterol desaturase family protein [Bacteroidota bacterium]